MATLLCQRTACLRSIQSASKSFPLARATFSTARFPQQTQPSKPSQRLSLSIRHASTTTTTQSEVPEHILTWDRFFDLRRKRRWLNTGCSVLTSFAAVGLVTPLLAQQDFDQWGAQISGLDPIIVLGVSTFIVAAGGWLFGPSFGSTMFSMWAARRGWNKAIAEKEKNFYARIKRYRADAGGSSPQNPAPDYYGEKIASVKDYRRWLRDQRAFTLKKNKNLF